MIPKEGINLCPKCGNLSYWVVPALGWDTCTNILCELYEPEEEDEDSEFMLE
jgi:hypothetical protein